MTELQDPCQLGHFFVTQLSTTYADFGSQCHRLDVDAFNGQSTVEVWYRLRLCRMLGVVDVSIILVYVTILLWQNALGGIAHGLTYKQLFLYMILQFIDICIVAV